MTEAVWPKVSVVMPVYNCERHLCTAIDSILMQTMRDFEFLIVYDESSDHTLEIVNRYAAADQRIGVVNGNKDGLIDALNEGIRAAKGQYIARMDADDISLPTRLARQVELMDAVNADICGCHWLKISETGKALEAKLVPLSQETFTVFLAGSVPFAHGSVVIRKAFLERNLLCYGGARYAEDYQLWVDIYSKGGRFANVDDFLFKYRETPNSLSERVKRKNHLESKRVRRDFVKRHAEDCTRAIEKILSTQMVLSQIEAIYLIIASALVSLEKRSLLFFKVVARTPRKILGLSLLYFIRGV